MKLSLKPFECIRFEDASEILCGHCQVPLERHQPDPEQPDRLLGTCYGCGAWYLVDLQAAVMMVLPDPETSLIS